MLLSNSAGCNALDGDLVGDSRPTDDRFNAGTCESILSFTHTCLVRRSELSSDRFNQLPSDLFRAGFHCIEGMCQALTPLSKEACEC